MAKKGAQLSQVELESIAASIEALSSTAEEILDDQKEMEKLLVATDTKQEELLRVADELSTIVRGPDGLVVQLGVLKSQVAGIKETMDKKEKGAVDAKNTWIAQLGVAVAIAAMVVGLLTNPSCQWLFHPPAAEKKKTTP